MTYPSPPTPNLSALQFIDQVWKDEEIMQFGDGSTSRDYTYISDIVDGVIRSLDRPAGYQIYNLGNGSPVSLSSFIKLVEESVGTPAKIRIYPVQPGDVPRTCANITKAREMLGYDPRVSFADGIRRTVVWYQDRAGRNAVEEAAASATATPVLNIDNDRSRYFAATLDGENGELVSVACLVFFLCVFVFVVSARKRRHTRHQDGLRAPSVLRQREDQLPDDGFF